MESARQLTSDKMLRAANAIRPCPSTSAMLVLRRPTMVALLLFDAFCVTNFANADQTTEERFAKEAPSAWTELDNWLRNLSLRYVSTDTVSVEGETGEPRVDTVKMLVDGDSFLIERNTSYPGGDAKWIVDAVNPSYGMQLARTDATSPWVISGVTNSYPDDYVKPLRQRIVGFAAPQANVALIPLTRLVTHPHFHLQEAARVLSANRDLVRITFLYSPADSQEQAETLMRGGWIVLNPADYWSVENYELDMDGGGKMIGEIEYGNAAGSQPRPVLKRVYGTRTERGEGDNVTTYSEYRFRQVAPAEIMLATYGLPEIGGAPGGTVGRRTTWFLICGVLLTAIGFMFSRRRRQKMAA